MKENPLVSVIIPTYKRPVTLARAIDSVLESSYKQVEIIVVDDNNNGDEFRMETEKVMEKYLNFYPNIIYIKHSKNRNGSAARNSGIQKSNGKYLMFLDDDDAFMKKKIEAQVECLENRDSSWGACYTKYIDIQEEKIVSKCKERKEGRLLVDELARNLFIHAGSNLMIRREVVLEIGGFDESFLRNQEIEFLVRILRKYKLAYVDVWGLKVYVHAKVHSINYYELTEQYLEKFKYEIEALTIKEKNAVYSLIGLQLMRNAFENRKFKYFWSYKEIYKLKVCWIMIYFLHLIKRKLTKKSYGFNMNIIKRGK